MGIESKRNAQGGSLIRLGLAAIVVATLWMGVAAFWVVDVLADALAPLANDIQLAFVFGTMAGGKQTAGSDIDVLVIGKSGFKGVVKVLHLAEKVLRREINPKVYSQSEWQRLVEANDRFFAEVMDKPKLLIMGNKHEFGELGR